MPCRFYQREPYSTLSSALVKDAYCVSAFVQFTSMGTAYADPASLSIDIQLTSVWPCHQHTYTRANTHASSHCNPFILSVVRFRRTAEYCRRGPQHTQRNG